MKLFPDGDNVKSSSADELTGIGEELVNIEGFKYNSIRVGDVFESEDFFSLQITGVSVADRTVSFKKEYSKDPNEKNETLKLDDFLKLETLIQFERIEMQAGENEIIILSGLHEGGKIIKPGVILRVHIYPTVYRGVSVADGEYSICNPSNYCNCVVLELDTKNFRVQLLRGKGFVKEYSIQELFGPSIEGYSPSIIREDKDVDPSYLNTPEGIALVIEKWNGFEIQGQASFGRGPHAIIVEKKGMINNMISN